MLSTYSVSWLTQSVRKGTFPFIDKTWLNQCAKRFSDYKISIEMNIDKFKLRIKCETTFQLFWLFNRVQFYTIIHLNYFSCLLPSKSPLFAYKLVCIEQPGRPGCSNTAAAEYTCMVHVMSWKPIVIVSWRRSKFFPWKCQTSRMFHSPQHL